MIYKRRGPRRAGYAPGKAVIFQQPCLHGVNPGNACLCKREHRLAVKTAAYRVKRAEDSIYERMDLDINAAVCKIRNIIPAEHRLQRDKIRFQSAPDQCNIAVAVSLLSDKRADFPSNIFDFVVYVLARHNLHAVRRAVVWRRRLLRIRLRNPCERAGRESARRFQQGGRGHSRARLPRGAHKARRRMRRACERAGPIALPKARTGQRGPDMRAVRQHKLQKIPFRAHKGHKAVNKHIVAGKKIPPLQALAGARKTVVRIAVAAFDHRLIRVKNKRDV